MTPPTNTLAIEAKFDGLHRVGPTRRRQQHQSAAFYQLLRPCLVRVKFASTCRCRGVSTSVIDFLPMGPPRPKTAPL